MAETTEQNRVGPF